MLNSQQLKEFVENNPKLVQRKESTNFPGLFVLKYTRKVFYDNLWNENPLLLECRGLVVDENYNVIVKPFTKVFNHMENGTNLDRDELCTVVRKVNGFMACVTKNTQASPDKVIISTTGSLDSDFVDLAASHFDLDKMFHDMFERETLIFEICDESDPHIIKEELGPYLIGGSWDGVAYSESLLDSIGKGFEFKRPEVMYEMRFSDVVEMSRKVQHEGFMVYSEESNKALKIKSPYYLFTKFIARLNEGKLADHIANDSLHKAMKYVDEEYYPIIHYISRRYGSAFATLDEQKRINVIRNYFEGRE